MASLFIFILSGPVTIYSQTQNPAATNTEQQKPELSSVHCITVVDWALLFIMCLLWLPWHHLVTFLHTHIKRRAGPKPICPGLRVKTRKDVQPDCADCAHWTCSVEFLWKVCVLCSFLGKREVKYETLCNLWGRKKYMPLESFHLFHLRTTVSLMLLVEMETMPGYEYPGNIYEKVMHCFTDHKIVGHR